MVSAVMPASAEMPAAVLVSTGTLRCVVVLSPSWPDVLSPQAATVASAHSARLWLPPAATAITVLLASAETPAAVLTATGTRRGVAVLSPSWPNVL